MYRKYETVLFPFDTLFLFIYNFAQLSKSFLLSYYFTTCFLKDA
nr:MAG TPA: hypothetical protein [Microviridae sp.]